MASSSDSRLKFSDLPYDCLYHIFGYMSYHEVAFYRLICRNANTVCHSVLCSGAENLRMKLNRLQTKLKAQLPRRESARRGHMASDLLEVVNSVENRVSIIRLALDRYLATGQLTFFPGKVLDEAFRIIAHIETLSTPPRDADPPHPPFTALQKVTMLRDLRDLSTMASEHIDDVILPSLRHRPASIEPIFRRFSLCRPHDLVSITVSPEKAGSSSTNLQSPAPTVPNTSSSESQNHDDPMVRLCGLFFDQFRALSGQVEELKKTNNNKITQLINEVNSVKQQLAQEHIISSSLAKKLEVTETALGEMRRLTMNSNAGSSIPQVCETAPALKPPSSKTSKRKLTTTDNNNAESSRKNVKVDETPVARRVTRATTKPNK